MVDLDLADVLGLHLQTVFALVEVQLGLVVTLSGLQLFDGLALLLANGVMID